MLRELFDSVARRQPEALALVDGEFGISYAELVSRSDRFARYLADVAGVRHGDRVAVCLPNCWEVAAGFLASSGMGAVWVPFHPGWCAREIAAFASALSLRALITNRECEQTWRDGEVLPPTVLLADDPALQDTLRGSTAALPPSPSPGDEPALCGTTSGSTGRPRIFLRTQANLLAAARSTATSLGIKPGWRMLSVVPFHHCGGFENCLLMPLVAGATAVVLPAFIPASVEAAVARHQIQLLMGSPFIYAMLLESNVNRASFASVEIAISFGAPMAKAVVHRCIDRLGIRIRQLYGTSETGVIAIEPPGAPGQTVPAGRPVDSMEVHIVDEQGRLVEPGSIGYVAVRGPGVIAGYLDQPDSDRESFQQGFFRSGDLGRMDASGELILCGRSNSILNLGGIKVAPAEIEDVLLEMPEVRDCVVRGVPDERQGEIPAAIIAVRSGCELSRRDIVAHCRRRLAEFKIPRRIELVDSIPVEVTGKRPVAWSTSSGNSQQEQTPRDRGSLPAPDERRD
jgi:long-chain acyl-CoA synthetase